MLQRRDGCTRRSSVAKDGVRAASCCLEHQIARGHLLALHSTLRTPHRALCIPPSPVRNRQSAIRSAHSASRVLHSSLCNPRSAFGIWHLAFGDRQSRTSPARRPSAATPRNAAACGTNGTATPPRTDRRSSGDGTPCPSPRSPHNARPARSGPGRGDPASPAAPAPSAGSPGDSAAGAPAPARRSCAAIPALRRAPSRGAHRSTAGARRAAPPGARRTSDGPPPGPSGGSSHASAASRRGVPPHAQRSTAGSPRAAPPDSRRSTAATGRARTPDTAPPAGPCCSADRTPETASPRRTSCTPSSSDGSGREATASLAPFWIVLVVVLVVVVDFFLWLPSSRLGASELHRACVPGLHASERTVGLALRVSTRLAFGAPLASRHRRACLGGAVTEELPLRRSADATTEPASVGR